MTPTLINALHAAVTLAAHHRRLADNSSGATREYHLCEPSDLWSKSKISDGKLQRRRRDARIQATALHQQDVATAQALIARHVLPEWLASEQAPRLLGGLAQDIADAIGAARADGARP